MSDMIDELKKGMGYTEKPAAKCDDCTFCEEKECHYTDRSWIHTCTRNPDARFEVMQSARCNSFKHAVSLTRPI